MNPRKKHTSVTQLPPELWMQVIYPRFLDTNTLGKIQITQKAKYSEVNETLFNTENLLNRWLQADLDERANLISLLKKILTFSHYEARIIKRFGKNFYVNCLKDQISN